MNFRQTITSLLAMAMAATAVLSGCGSGGAPNATSSTAFAEAALALKAGDIPTAQSKYDEALAADSGNREAAFGAGFTRLIALMESGPSNEIMSLLGQKAMKISALFGPEGYLKALHDVYSVDAVLEGLEGPFTGAASLTGQSYFADDTGECRMQGIRLEMFNREKKSKLTVSMVLAIDAPDGTPLYRLQEGDQVSAGQKFANELCFEETRLAWLDVYEDKTGYSSSYETTSGQLVATQLAHESGGKFTFGLKDIDLPNSDASKRKFISGEISDLILDQEPDKSPYFPFVVPSETDVNGGRKAQILRLAKDGLMVSEIQDQIFGYIPLVQEIADLFDRADKEDTFQFVVPKELYFGDEDIALNRADLKAIRSAVEFKLAGLFFSNSWDCPVNLGDYYDEQGHSLYTQEQVLEQINQCLTLREEHYVADAKEHVVKGFDLLVENDELRQTVEFDGIFDNDGKGKGGYVELRDALDILKNSLEDDQSFLYVDPAFTINMGNLFTNPPDAASIDADPFVIENGEIKPVEAFFKAYLEGIIDFDTSANYKNAFSAVGKDFWHLVFDEFNVFTVGGKDIGFGDFYD